MAQSVARHPILESFLHLLGDVVWGSAASRSRRLLSVAHVVDDAPPEVFIVGDRDGDSEPAGPLVTRKSVSPPCRDDCEGRRLPKCLP